MVSARWRGRSRSSSSVNPDVIEAQLAHGKSGPLGDAYDRAEFMAQRRTMMAQWTDYLEGLRRGQSELARDARSHRDGKNVAEALAQAPGNRRFHEHG